MKDEASHPGSGVTGSMFVGTSHSPFNWGRGRFSVLSTFEKVGTVCPGKPQKVQDAPGRSVWPGWP